jgi:hypothetical protein
LVVQVLHGQESSKQMPMALMPQQQLKSQGYGGLVTQTFDAHWESDEHAEPVHFLPVGTHAPQQVPDAH